MMGKPNLIWSPIQLKLSNQYNIVLIGRITRVNSNIYGVCIIEYFQVIEIVDDSKPYPSLLGIDWDLDNYTIVDLKKRQMIYES
jgi:hypothetical protein